MKGQLLLHSWPIDLIDLPFVFIRPEATGGRESSFMQCRKGGPPVDSSNSMNEGRGEYEEGRLFYMKMKKGKGSDDF